MRNPVPDVLVERRGPVTVITLNRPDTHNALGQRLIEELASAVDAFEADPTQSVAVVTGAGPRAFCSGGDQQELVADMAAGTRMPIYETADLAGLGSCQKPTIAAINGLAVAGGLELAISCDIRIAASSAWFALFEVRRGFVAAVAASVLPRVMPLGAALDLLLSGDRLEAEDAFRLGLVQKVVPDAELLDAALAKADAIAANSPSAVWGTKQVVRYWRDLQLADSHRHYRSVIEQVFSSGDVYEGPRAFLERRPAKFNQSWSSPDEEPLA